MGRISFQLLETPNFYYHIFCTDEIDIEQSIGLLQSKDFTALASQESSGLGTLVFHIECPQKNYEGQKPRICQKNLQEQ